MEPLRFLDVDVGAPPAPGWYAGTITTACWRQSSHHNRMVYLVVGLDNVGSPYDRISDYFVLEGVSPRGIACSRRRLVTVFRAGGLFPRAGDEIRPDVLEGLKVEVKLAHELWKDKVRLQITEYRPAVVPYASGSDDDGAGETAVWPPPTTPQDSAYGK